MGPWRYPWKRYLLANWRDVRVLVRQFRTPLVLFGLSVLMGGLAFDLLYTHSQVRDLTFAESVYAVFSMIFFEQTVPFPPQWYLELFFFVMPIVGLGLIAQGVVNFGVMLFNKAAREDEWQVAIASTCKDHIIIAGVGRLGFRIIQQLLSFGEEVVGIEINPETEFVQRVMRLKVPVIIGDATHPDILQQAGVERACTIVPCTENDLTNLEIALVAREIKGDIHVVLRMFDDDLAPKVARGFNIPTTFSTSGLSAPAFAAAATRADITHAFYVDGRLLNVSEMTVNEGSSLVGRQVGDLEQCLDLSVILHRRDGQVDLHPRAEVTLQGGDRICVFATLEVLGHLGQLNQKKAGKPGR